MTGASNQNNGKFTEVLIIILCPPNTKHFLRPCAGDEASFPCRFSYLNVPDSACSHIMHDAMQELDDADKHYSSSYDHCSLHHRRGTKITIGRGGGIIVHLAIIVMYMVV